VPKGRFVEGRVVAGTGLRAVVRWSERAAINVAIAMRALLVGLAGPVGRRAGSGPGITPFVAFEDPPVPHLVEFEVRVETLPARTLKVFRSPRWAFRGHGAELDSVVHGPPRSTTSGAPRRASFAGYGRGSGNARPSGPLPRGGPVVRIDADPAARVRGPHLVLRVAVKAMLLPSRGSGGLAANAPPATTT
jgi:hypothetical protein